MSAHRRWTCPRPLGEFACSTGTGAEHFNDFSPSGVDQDFENERKIRLARRRHREVFNVNHNNCQVRNMVV